MNTQHKVYGTLAACALLAAGLFSAAKPAAASGLAHSAQIARQPLIAQYGGFNGGRDHDFRGGERHHGEFQHEQFGRGRHEEIRREEARRRFRDDRHGDYHNRGRYDRQGDSLRIVVR